MTANFKKVRLATFDEVIKNDSQKLNEGIARTVKSLKEDVETEILVNEEIDINDIARYFALEKHYAEERLPVDMGEFLYNPDSCVELEEFRQIFGRLNETFRSEGTNEKCPALSLLKIPATDCYNTETLRKLIWLSNELIGVADKVKERFTNISPLTKCEKFNDTNFVKLQEYQCR